MKLAILLFGLSKTEIIHHSGNKIFIDYEKSYENYKKIIFDYFENIGYDIDVFFTTNILDNKNEKKICEIYKPIKYNFIEKARHEKLNNVIELCINSRITYDLILITRFDLLFQKNFSESNIDFDKFNLVSILEKPHLICDNFYLFPYKYLKIFSKIVKETIIRENSNVCAFHNIQKHLYHELGINSVNYILNENCFVYQLSFYKIVRNLCD